jgi:ribosome recycling factor
MNLLARLAGPTELAQALEELRAQRAAISENVRTEVLQTIRERLGKKAGDEWAKNHPDAVQSATNELVEHYDRIVDHRITKLEGILGKLP